MFERELEKYTSEPFTLFFIYLFTSYSCKTSCKAQENLRRTLHIHVHETLTSLSPVSTWHSQCEHSCVSTGCYLQCGLYTAGEMTSAGHALLKEIKTKREA